MYIVEIINPETSTLAYSPEVFKTQDDAEEYLQEVCEDRHGVGGIIVSILLEKSAYDESMIITSSAIVYHT